MPHVQVRPSKDLRNHYREIADIAKKNNPVIITNHGRGDTVLVSMEDYAKFEDYMQNLQTTSGKNPTIIREVNPSKSVLGLWKGEAIIPDDFNAPLDDLKEYMY